jgi:hypothetical protein
MMERWNIGIMDFGRLEEWKIGKMRKWGNGGMGSG